MQAEPTPPTPPTALTPLPTAARRAGGLLAAESVVLGVLAVLAGLATAAGEQAFSDAALGLAGAAAAMGLLLLGLALAVLRGRGWARTPALVIQLIALPVGTDQVLGRQWAIGTVVLLVAGTTAYHLLAASREPAG